MWLYEDTTMHVVDSTSDKFIASGKCKCKINLCVNWSKLYSWFTEYIFACETT